LKGCSLNTTISKGRGISVLLIDDQAIIGEAVRRMLAGEPDITYHFCQNPEEALARVEQLQPTVILQDLIMPRIDGLTLVRQFRANPATKDVPMIVLSTKEEARIKADGFAAGANDYLVKLPDKIELIARIRYHSKAYINFLERNEAYEQLAESQRALAFELNEAADYVRSILPAHLRGDIVSDWKFVSSTSLGGDAFGYHWIDPENFAIYLLDVCGHGVGAALLSVSVMNVLRAQSLPSTDFRNPGAVLQSLNNSFQMENQNNMYFTMWYGVFNKPSRTIEYASGGHPPSILLTGPSREDISICRLQTDGMMVGGDPDQDYQSARCALQDFSRLYVFSDGAFEVKKPGGDMLTLTEFTGLLERQVKERKDLGALIEHLTALQGSASFDDDLALLELTFLNQP
jgi:phosphoserine phosphatase RsbU/P